MREVISALALGTALAALLGTYGHSADMRLRPRDAPLAPTCYWCGLYIGMNAGYRGSPIATRGLNVKATKPIISQHSRCGDVFWGRNGYDRVFCSVFLRAEAEHSITSFNKSGYANATK